MHDTTAGREFAQSFPKCRCATGTASIDSDVVNKGSSKFVDRKNYLSRYTHERVLEAQREHLRAAALGNTTEAEWLRALKEDLPRFIPFLRSKAGLEFRGRILEIGAGGAWLSAELSKLPGVVEITATDILPDALVEQAPKVFALTKAIESKIIRTPADFHELPFAADTFDFVVCSAGLRHATNIVQVIREAKRVLKPGGRFVAIREPIKPLMSLSTPSGQGAASGPFYSIGHYEELFRQGGLPVDTFRVNLSSGFRFFLEECANGLMWAHYAFVGVKRPAAKVTVAHPPIRHVKRVKGDGQVSV
jgi:2-polyprenyl-3-methyl-5-hydroxy-6-metoxy-1,4-benzoquinol methylase